jgi:hypothetical protein
MLDFVNKYGFNVFSQNNEDGIIEEVLSRLKIVSGCCVEFGGADGTFCSNTAHLLTNGWKGKLIEGDEILFDQMLNNERLPDSVEMENDFVTPENVNRLVPDCNLLSIDIDGNDYEVWKAYKHKPAVVIIEINSSFNPEVYHFSKEQGSSYAMMNKLGEEKGYFLLCHTGNLIFIDNKYKKLFPEVKFDPITNHNKFFNTSWLK